MKEFCGRLATGVTGSVIASVVLSSGSAVAQTSTHSLDNGTLRVGIDSVWGGAIVNLQYRDGLNWVDNGIPDPGRQIQASLYNLDQAYDPLCFPCNTSCTWGWNPVHAGNACNLHVPATVNSATSTQISTTCRDVPQWNGNAGLARSRVDIAQLIQFHPARANVVQIDYTVTNNESFPVATAASELPVVYLTTELDRAYTYRGGAPWTFAAPEDVTPAPNSGGIGISPMPAERWAAWINSASGVGLGLYVPSAFIVPNQTDSYFWVHNLAPPGTTPTHALQRWAQIPTAAGSQFTVRAYLIAGTLTEIRQAVYEMEGHGPALPSTPTGLAATPGDRQVALTWNASSGATSYNVKSSTTSGGPYDVIASNVSSTSFTDTGLNNGTTYYYVVSARNAGGESGNSGQVSAVPQVGLPSAPTGLTATAGNAQIALSWNASAGASSYRVKRSTTSGGPYTTVGTPTSTTFTNTGLTNGTRYYYVVSAVNVAGESGNSSQVSAVPQGVAPPAPTGLAAAWGSALANLAWNASSGAATYRVKRSTTSGGPYTVIATGVTSTIYQNSGLANGTTYYYVVSAVDSGGTESAKSNQASVTPHGIIGGNLVANPSYELGTGADASSWTEGVNHARSNDKRAVGTWALKSTYTGTGTATRSPSITVAPYTNYHFSGWIYKSTAAGGACIDMSDILGETQLCASQSGRWEWISGAWDSGPTSSLVVRSVTDGNPTGAIWFDLLRLIRNNLVTNASFEGGSGTSASSWSQGINHTRASDRPRTGGWSLKSTYSGSGTDSRTGSLAVMQNTMYVLSGWVYKSSTTGGACIDMNDIASETQLCASQTNTWQFLSGTWNSGAITSVVVRLVTDGNPNGSIWFDDVRFAPR